MIFTRFGQQVTILRNLGEHEVEVSQGRGKAKQVYTYTMVLAEIQSKEDGTVYLSFLTRETDLRATEGLVEIDATIAQVPKVTPDSMLAAQFKNLI